LKVKLKNGLDLQVSSQLYAAGGGGFPVRGKDHPMKIKLLTLTAAAVALFATTAAAAARVAAVGCCPLCT
jgi:hypothetical protein